MSGQTANRAGAPRVSIVIRSYNEARHIERLFEELARLEVDFGYEVILVDSGSEDQTRAIAARWGARVLRIDPQEFTFGYSLNRGIAEARGAFVALISAHCYPQHPDWLKALIAPFADPRIALVYGRQRGNGTTKFSEHQVFEQWFPDESNPHQRLPFCNNANAAIRRSVWEHLAYDETLTGLEDLEWAKRAIDAGHLLAYTASAGVIHVHDETWRQVFRRYRREAMAFTRIFPDERFSAWEFSTLVVLNVCADYLSAIRRRAFVRNAAAIPLFRLCQFWGTYLGYREPRSVTPQLRMRFYYPNRPAVQRVVPQRAARHSVAVK